MSSAVSPLALGRHQVSQGVHRPALIWMMVNTQLPATPDTAPFPYQRRSSEEVALNRHQIKAPHVSRRILAAQMRLVRKNLDLHETTISCA